MLEQENRGVFPVSLRRHRFCSLLRPGRVPGHRTPMLRPNTSAVLQRYVASLLDNAAHSINRNCITKMTGGWEPVQFVQCPHTISITDLSWRLMYLSAAVNNSYRYSVGKQGNALTMTSLTCPKS